MTDLVALYTASVTIVAYYHCKMLRAHLGIAGYIDAPRSDKDDNLGEHLPQRHQKYRAAFEAEDGDPVCFRLTGSNSSAARSGWPMQLSAGNPVRTTSMVSVVDARLPVQN